MRLLLKSVGVAVGAVLIGSALLSAQPQNRRAGARMYDPATEVTLNGTIDSVCAGTWGHMTMGGTHLTLKAENGTIEVMLGPSAYIASKNFTFAVGDTIQVTGSKVSMGAMEFVIAREVVKDGKTLTLRDKNGVPKWAGMGRHRPRSI